MAEEKDLTPEESKSRSSLSPIKVAIALSSAPCLLTVVLFVFASEHMLQLVLGPPVGAYIPDTRIPMGWPFGAAFIFFELIAVGVNFLFVKVLRNKTLNQKLWVIIVICLLSVSVGVQAIAYGCAILGPSAVQLYKAYISAGG